MIVLDDWPDCAIDGCPNKCCLALNSVFCFPHTPGNKHVKSMKIDALHTVASPEERFEAAKLEAVAASYIGKDFSK